jgi:hypothetical protein
LAHFGVVFVFTADLLVEGGADVPGVGGGVVAFKVDSKFVIGDIFDFEIRPFL